MPTTPKSGIRTPVLTDTANVPRDIGYVGSDIDGRLVTVCTSATRPTGGAAFPGAVIYETDTKKTLTYDGTTWLKPVRVLYAGTETAILGTNPPAGTEIIERVFTASGTVAGGGGGFGVTFPAAFANGITALIATTVDGAAILDPYSPGWSLSGWYWVAHNGSGGFIANGTVVRVSLQVWGW